MAQMSIANLLFFFFFVCANNIAYHLVTYLPKQVMKGQKNVLETPVQSNWLNGRAPVDMIEVGQARPRKLRPFVGLGQMPACVSKTGLGLDKLQPSPAQ